MTVVWRSFFRSTGPAISAVLQSCWAGLFSPSWWSSTLTPLLAIGLALSLTLTSCGSAGNSLSGSYVEDTMTVAESLLGTIAISQDDPARPEAESEARVLINDYMALYRPKARINGLPSFTTMQTALNSLAGHYTNYANRPLPDALKTRLEKELKKAETAVVRGT
ncbi:photosystem II protein Psb27 [Synechococcus sp. 1G10]|uniref:photosystem II protein Psb27 n=1 Tax=Synechococcus sp. 1G10 TaxID=2025605 RepID=UPI000B98CDA8|nr:photosystem II protein Psb27 [Synechococcus sp. 1G10]